MHHINSTEQANLDFCTKYSRTNLMYKECIKMHKNNVGASHPIVKN